MSVQTSQTFSVEKFRDNAYISIDTMTLVFNDCKVNDLLQLLGLSEYQFKDWKIGVTTIGVINDVHTFSINGVRFDLPTPEIKMYSRVWAERHVGLDPDKFFPDVDPGQPLDFLENPVDIFDYQFSKIRLHLTGEGMNFLRGRFLEKEIFADDYLFRTFCGLSEQNRCHFTRLDFALDFFNQEAPMLNDMTSFLVANGRVQSSHATYYASDVNKSHHGCTIYIGSKSGPQMLRIYDKLAESTDEDGNWKKQPPYDIPQEYIQSWVRVELQARVRGCPKFMVGPDGHYFLTDPCAYIDYLMSIFNVPKQVVSWHLFFKPFLDGTRSIIQNRNYSEVKTYVDRCENVVKRDEVAFIVFIARYGWKKFFNMLETDVIRMQKDCNPQFMRLLNNLHSDGYQSLYDLPYFKRGINGLAVLDLPDYEFLKIDEKNVS